MSANENVAEDCAMPSVTNDLKDDADDNDVEELELVAKENKILSVSFVDTNSLEFSREDVSKRKFVNKSLAFNNHGYTDDDDDGDDEDEDDDDYEGNEQKDIDERINTSKHNTVLTNTSVVSEYVEEIDKTRDVSRQLSGKKSVTFKNECESNGATQVSENKSRTFKDDQEFPSEKAKESATLTKSEDIKEEESESGVEIPNEINFPPELLTQVESLRCSGKIEKAAFIDFSGNILVRSRGMQINSEDAAVVLRVLKSPDKSLVKIRIGKEDFTCFKNSTTSFIGRADDDFLCASSCLDFVVVGISDPNSPGSCIHEVSRFVKHRYRNSINGK